MTNIQIPKKLFHKKGYKKINGIDHFYRIIGEGEPFIFLHGGPGMWHDELVPFFIDFAENHQAIFYDQRGNGNSQMEKIDETTFTIELLVEDLEALHQEFGFKKMNIIGHSWGGLLGMYYASAYPDHVKRLILIAPAPVNTELLIEAYEEMYSRFTEEEWNYIEDLYESEAYLSGDPALHNEALQLSEGKTFHNKEARDIYLDIAVFDERKAKNTVALSEQGREMKMNITVQDQLEKISSPTLIIQGREDFIPAKAAELAKQLIKKAQLFFVDESGHYPFIEAKDNFFKIMNTFIEETR